MASHQVLMLSIWCCATESGHVVSAICDEWQRGTHVDGKAIQPTTTATNCLQPQHTHNWSCTSPSHTSIHTHTIVHTHMARWWWRLNNHTVMTSTPWFHGNHSLHQHHCGAQHPYPTHHSCRLLGGALAIPIPHCAPQVA